MNDNATNALAFDLLMLNGDDLRRKPYMERKAALRRGTRQGPRGQNVCCGLSAWPEGHRLKEVECSRRKPGLKSKIRKRRQRLA